RGEARGAPGTIAGSGQFLFTPEPRKSVPRRLAEQSLDARDLDRIDPATTGRSGGVRHCCVRCQAARTSSAASVPANPRQMMSAMLLRGSCAEMEMGTSVQSG